MSYKYHGNWCGPGWSDGEYQNSVRGFAPAIDEFDETCRQHDFAFADGQALNDADMTFIHANLGKNAKRTAAAMAVYARNKLTPSPITPNMTTQKKNNKNNLRGSNNGNKRTMQNNTTRKGNDVFRNAPVSISSRRTGAAPTISTTKSGIVVSHRTFLSPVSNDINFTVTQFSTNPALGTTFPWLSKIAARYDKYRFRKLRFEYRSVCPTSTSGVCMMSFDYDASDEAPTSKLVQAQTIPNAENNIWMNNDLNVPCDSTWRYTRQGTIPATDVKTYDLGTMWLSTIYGNGVIGGELYVEYVVELDKPTEPAALAMTSTATGPLVASPLYSSGTIPPVDTGKALPFKVTSSTILTCLVPGTYFLTYTILGSTITGFIAPSCTGTLTTLFNTVTTTQATKGLKIVCNKDDTLNFSSIITAATVTSGRLDITEYF